MPTPKPKTRKPLGAPLPPVKDDYIDPPPTEDEVNALVALWDQYVDKRYRGLLRAQNKGVMEQTKQEVTSRFLWDDQTGQYIEVATGRRLSRRELHRAFSEFINAYSNG